MPDEFIPPRRRWPQKFRHALRGARRGVRGQASFTVHAVFAVLVIALAALLRMPLLEWAVLLLCIALVLTAEMFNSALEQLARAVDRRYNRHLAEALDIGSAAVLLAAAGAAVVGALLFLHRLWTLLPAWWAP